MSPPFYQLNYRAPQQSPIFPLAQEQIFSNRQPHHEDTTKHGRRAVKSRPILFSAAMVRAILDGSKTQTRRILKPQLSFDPNDHQGTNLSGKSSAQEAIDQVIASCPYGQPGDQLTVKEDAWMWCGKLVSGLTQKTKKPKICWMETRNTQPVYCADHPLIPQGVPENGTHRVGDLNYMWRKKIARFVPAWASRITLEIVSIRIERLNEITHADAIAEGCPPHPECPTQSVCGDYERLWESINGPGSWNANPWVWALTFKRIKP